MGNDNGHVTTGTCDRRMRDLRQDLEQDIKDAEDRQAERLTEHRQNCKGADMGDALWQKILFILAVGAAAIIGNNVDMKGALNHGKYNEKIKTVAPDSIPDTNTDSNRMR